MSEYQYYEFQAIDSPLTQAQIRELRGYSTRATITPTRFVNEYHWGDFKGDPAVWIEKYDAFFYLANWGARDFMLRLPRRALDLEEVRRYCCGESAAARRKGERVILEFHSEDDERCLNDLAKRGEEAWTKVDQLIATKQPRKYDEAVALLRDLRELAVRDGKDQEVSAHLRRIWMQHEGKPSFIGRLRKAGLLDSVR